MNQPARSVCLAGNELKRIAHACAFFHSREEEYRVMLPFAKDGFEKGEKLFRVVDAAYLEECIQRLGEVSAGIVNKASQLEVHTWEDAHLREGKFDQERMLALVHEALEAGRESGFTGTRFWGSMEWALSGLPGVDEMVEYEAKLNLLLAGYDDVVVCSYDLARFSAETVMDVLRTHPMVIIGGVLQENPFFVPPAEFLHELQERRHREHCSSSHAQG